MASVIKLNIGTQLDLFTQMSGSATGSFDGKTDIASICVPGLGPKSLDIGSDEIEEFNNILNSFDPETPPPTDRLGMIRTTLAVEGEGDDRVVTFRTANGKGVRSVNVPIGQWDNFLRFWHVAEVKTMPSLLTACLATKAAEAAKVAVESVPPAE